MNELTWVAVALTPDLPAGVAIPARVGSEDVAVWRAASGAVRIWGDRCPHRGMRLSHGFVRGETLACIYHGWRYGLDGGCAHIPAHPALEPPKTITARVFGCVEAGGVIFGTLDPEAPPPAAPEGLVPLRSVEIGAAAGVVQARLMPGEAGLMWSGDLALLVQPVGEDTCRAHALIPPGTDPKAASRALEALRRTCEED
ncbi:MAG: Rieske (2Fe-2S) protein [Rubellimicrobium sp.]|nr:Rieske (2Fe-2S) protein [Rubellimicrobium sp.]